MKLTILTLNSKMPFVEQNPFTSVQQGANVLG